MGATPSALALSAESTTTAAAPSVMPDELPAVTVPVLSLKTGGELREARAGRRRRAECSSFAKSTSPFLPGTFTGKVSAANRPSSQARAARCWLRRAKASCSSRGMRYCSARVSAVSPMSLSQSGHMEAVAVHAVDRLLVTQAIAPARAGQQVGHPAHRLDAAREHHLGVAVPDGPEARDRWP